MSNINDVGPAFPTTQANFDNMEPAGDGMTIRDYFAAKAMQAYVSRDRSNWSAIDDDEFDALVSRYAYEMADAMLKAREGGAS